MTKQQAGRLNELEQRLGVKFRDPALLELALIHRSLLREPAFAGGQSNERLEFLGDAIIGAVVARELYDRLPAATEGELTLLRTWLVRATTLGEWAASLELDRYLRLGKTDEGSTRRTRLLARTFEAVVGAIYADQGVSAVRRFLRPFIDPEIERQVQERPRLDSKSRLQQVTQSRFDLMPAYAVRNVSGPDHDPTFTVEVQIGNELQTTAMGRTKQEAEQNAARLALELLDQEGDR
jgi:ribonuclease-3